jgi:hypothetical protein
MRALPLEIPGRKHITPALKYMLYHSKSSIKKGINLEPTSVLPAVHVGEVVIGGANAFLLVANGVLAEGVCALEGLLTRRFEALGDFQAEMGHGKTMIYTRDCKKCRSVSC